MKRIGLTQRIETISSYDERRDALDQQWYKLLLEMQMLPIPLPNLAPELAPVLIDELKLDGVVFTGGNDLSHLELSDIDQMAERDTFELALISQAQKRSIPMFGVCRGMHIINHYFGGRLVKIGGHVAKDHSITALIKSRPLPKKVNSFHNWTIPIDGLATSLHAVGVDEAGNVEAFVHKTEKIAGVAWHPEREQEFNIYDIKFLKNILL
jgi:gamma-glutamyl-gamma-aminobutyrate hydrolase PuuD